MCHFCHLDSNTFLKGDKNSELHWQYGLVQLDLDQEGETCQQRPWVGFIKKVGGEITLGHQQAISILFRENKRAIRVKIQITLFKKTNTFIMQEGNLKVRRGQS